MLLEHKYPLGNLDNRCLAKLARISEDTSFHIVNNVCQWSLYNIHTVFQGLKGKRRIIEEPIPALKQLQKVILPFFEDVPLHPSCMARKGSSAVENAAMHQNAKHLLKIDIRKCYPSIHLGMTYVYLHEVGCPIRKSHLQGRHNLLIKSCGINRNQDQKADPLLLDTMLPTGAPTSPILCNLALKPLDERVSCFLQEHYPDKYIYTRYLDDLVISTSEDTRDWGIKGIVEHFIRDMGLTPHPTKSKWLTAKKSDNLVVTGVRVGDTKLGVPRSFSRTVRARLNNLARDQKPVDAETRGCLAYIKSIDQSKHDKLMEFYQRRLLRGSAT